MSREWDPIKGDWKVHRSRPRNRMTARRRRNLRARLAMMYGPFCYLCGLVKEPENLRLEHRVPLGRGGTNGIDNLALSCESCDIAKGCLTEVEYRRKLNDG